MAEFKILDYAHILLPWIDIFAQQSCPSVRSTLRFEYRAAFRQVLAGKQVIPSDLFAFADRAKYFSRSSSRICSHSEFPPPARHVDAEPHLATFTRVIHAHR